MINVTNDVSPAETRSAGELPVGETFTGTVTDINGDESTGLFLRTYHGLVSLTDPTVEFEPFVEDDFCAPDVTNFESVEVDATILSNDSW